MSLGGHILYEARALTAIAIVDTQTSPRILSITLQPSIGAVLGRSFVCNAQASLGVLSDVTFVLVVTIESTFTETYHATRRCATKWTDRISPPLGPRTRSTPTPLSSPCLHQSVPTESRLAPYGIPPAKSQTSNAAANPWVFAFAQPRTIPPAAKRVVRGRFAPLQEHKVSSVPSTLPPF